MYSVGITGFFSAIHALTGDVSEHEKLAHSHDYKLEWILEITKLDDRGFSIDISLLEGLRDSAISEIEGVNLNEHSGFLNKPVSLENLCDFIYRNLYTGLLQRTGTSVLNSLRSMEIRIWENDYAWAGIKRTGEQIGK